MDRSFFRPRRLVRRTRATAPRTEPPSLISMDTTISPASFCAEELTLSQLPLFSEDRVYDPLPLPHTPPSVCKACWKGPLARYLGLLSVSETGDQWYPPWPKKNSYSTSLTKLKSRADAGCVWCRFILDEKRDSEDIDEAGDSEDINERLIITLGKYTRKWLYSSNQSYQALKVEINGKEIERNYVVSTAPGDPAASYISARSHIRDVGSYHAMALARQKIDKCVQGHQSCRILAYPNHPSLPTRLLDCADLAHTRLVTTCPLDCADLVNLPLVSPPGEHDKYLALSYVWGEDQSHKTTTSNLSMYERGIEPSFLPATIRDAIRVTHMLGFRWLWVDSLCIIQDSDEDKLHEIGRMHDIYRYAHLTIIAASAEKVSDGFLHKRSLPKGQIALPFICPPQSSSSTASQDSYSIARVQSGASTVYLGEKTEVDDSYHADLGDMCKRAWCMQEYLMSPRSLIFTPTTLHFRCLAGIQGVGDTLRPYYYNAPNIPRMLFLPDPPIVDPDSRECHIVHYNWNMVIMDYSSRTASVESDKLVACAAVAEQFSRVLRLDYLAGLWRTKVFLFDLLWETDTEDATPGRLSHTRPTAYRAPSWSWMAIEGHVHQQDAWTYSPESTALAKVVECWVTPEDPALPFGRVTGGTLILSGTLIPYRADLVQHTERYGRVLYQAPLPSLDQTRLCQQRGYGGRLNEDEQENDWVESETLSFFMDCEADWEIERIWIVPIAMFPKEDPCVRGLVLARSGSEHEKVRFRRVGTLHTGSGRDTLWIPLMRAMEDGEWPLVDIEIV
ncbi:hypothetical protein VTO73DRAFT_15300 [Trametes versicolor]